MDDLDPQALLDAMQTRLRHEASIGDDPLDIYRPSPGQLPDHVHHRVARICSDVAAAALIEAHEALEDEHALNEMLSRDVARYHEAFHVGGVSTEGPE